MPRTGYETTPPSGGGGVGLFFTIEKTDFLKGSKETGKAVDKITRDFNTKLKTKGYTITSEVVSYGDYNLGNVVVKALDSAVENSVQDWAKTVAAAGKQMYKEVIKSAPNRVKPQPGRIDTHLMLNSVYGRTTERKNFSRVEIGWTDTYYRYFSFQEDGTRTGPMPMGAIPKTAKYVVNEFNNTFGRMLKYRMEQIK